MTRRSVITFTLLLLYFASLKKIYTYKNNGIQKLNRAFLLRSWCFVEQRARFTSVPAEVLPAGHAGNVLYLSQQNSRQLLRRPRNRLPTLPRLRLRRGLHPGLQVGDTAPFNAHFTPPLNILLALFTLDDSRDKICQLTLHSKYSRGFRNSQTPFNLISKYSFRNEYIFFVLHIKVTLELHIKKGVVIL